MINISIKKKIENNKKSIKMTSEDQIQNTTNFHSLSCFIIDFRLEICQQTKRKKKKDIVTEDSPQFNRFNGSIYARNLKWYDKSANDSGVSRVTLYTRKLKWACRVKFTRGDVSSSYVLFSTLGRNTQFCSFNPNVRCGKTGDGLDVPSIRARRLLVLSHPRCCSRRPIDIYVVCGGKNYYKNTREAKQFSYRRRILLVAFGIIENIIKI